MIRVWSFEEEEADLPGRVLVPLLLLLLLLLLPILVLSRAPRLSPSEGDAVMERRWKICRRTGIGIIHKVSFSCRSGSVVNGKGVVCNSSDGTYLETTLSGALQKFGHRHTLYYN